MGNAPDGNTSAAPEVVISLPRQAWKIGVIDGRRNGVDDRKGVPKVACLLASVFFFFPPSLTSEVTGEGLIKEDARVMMDSLTCSNCVQVERRQTPMK